MTTYTQRGDLARAYRLWDPHTRVYIKMGPAPDRLKMQAVNMLCPWPDVNDWIKVWIEGEQDNPVSLPTDTVVYYAED